MIRKWRLAFLGVIAGYVLSTQAAGEAKDTQAEKQCACQVERCAMYSHSTPEALVRSIRHIMKTRPRQYRNGRTLLKEAEGYVKTMPDIWQRNQAGEAAAAKELAAFEALKFRALVGENPYIDFDETLVVLSDKVARKANWVGTHDLPRRGYTNRIARFNLRTGSLTDIYKAPDGAYIGEIDLHYEGDKLLFTSVDTNDLLQVMEIDVDGRNLRQLPAIPGKYVHNYGGIYLPDNRIVFSSTAPMIGVPCIGGSQSVPNLFQMDKDGGAVRQLTFEQDADWYPTVREDGQIMYLRWEYTDIMHYYSRIMMTMNPDGSNQRAIYGTQSLWPNSMFNARPVPGAPGKFVAVVSGHHGIKGSGKLTLFDTNKGYMHADGVVQHIPGYGRQVTHVTADRLYPEVDKKLLKQFPDLKEQVAKLISEHMLAEAQQGLDYHELNNLFYKTCYPLLRFIYPEMALDLDELVNDVFPQTLQPSPISPEYYLVVATLGSSEAWKLYLFDIFDNMVPLSDLAEVDLPYMVEPYPLKKRTPPPIIPDKVNLQDKEAVCYVQNVYRGPGLKGVPVGTIKSLRIFTYAYCYYKTGHHHHIGVESGWDIKRLLGSVRVEEDGSAMFKIPANTTISLQPLDAEGRAVQIFRSWLVAMPGEKLSCIGCHESPAEPPVATRTIASINPPQRISPHREQLEGYAFDTEIQPILDAYCVRCHDGADNSKPDFKNTALIETNRIEHAFSHAYHAFHRYFRRPGPESTSLMNVPYEFHASTSEGVQLLEKGHYGVKLDDESWQRIYTWIDLNVPYHGSWSSVYKIKPDRYEWTTNMAAYAASMRGKYACNTDDWELIPSKPYPVAVSETKGEELAPPLDITVKGWPFDRESAIKMQAAVATETRRVLELGNGVTLNLVRIPAGEFVMGSDRETPWEQPRHRVNIEQPFWICESEISNEVYFYFDPDHDASVYDQLWKDHTRPGYHANYRKQPAVRMSWHSAMAFCQWVSKQTGVKASLPTEAQWEWACRAGSDQAMSFGTLTADFSGYANLADKSMVKYAVRGVNPEHHPSLTGNRIYDFLPRIDEFDDKQFLVTGTRQYQPNAWGLYDMHGNVAEWTRSDYQRYPYHESQSNSGSAELRKVVRGGSFYDRPYRSTSSYRLGYLPWQGVFNVGFRIVVEEGL